MQTLNPLDLPLYNERLIEASAGTGKTFTIAVLYLRLLLGLGNENAYPRPLAVEEILVVTFTEAATEELRGRIRTNIHALRLACVRGSSDDPLFDQLLAQIVDLQEAISLLLAAERQMDEAAIYTIHGFCQRMLNLNAFESGSLFHQVLVQNELPLHRQVCADFWRRHCYPLSFDVAAAVSREWSGPEALLADLAPYLHGDLPVLLQPLATDETLLARHRQVVAAIDDVKRQWREALELAALITASGVDKRIYSSRYLPNWIQKVNEWAQQETLDYWLPKELARFGQQVLLEKTKQGTAPLHAIFVAIDHLLTQSLSLRDLLLARALNEVRAGIQREKRRRAELGFDDLLSRLDDALQGDGGHTLAQAISRRYPVAMIDEFQDTDPQQYRIFHAIYHNQPETGLLLIGDPKQAIYAFRGADIFTYMRARNEVSAHYTLGTNWRSAHGMVSAVNQLFSLLPRPFLFREIPFIPAGVSPAKSLLKFEVDGKSEPALRFWLVAGDGVGVSEYRQTLARQCATQIRDWLSAGQRGDAVLTSEEGSKQPLQASDITILVRSRTEAALMRDALNALNIPSVYFSNRDSVFAAPEARELLWLLQAALAPEHEQALRNALATSLLGLDAQALDTLNQDERAWDRRVEEFDDYRRCWERLGVLPMLRNIMVKHRIAENLLASPGGERRLTDILHIGELLQEAALQLDSAPALVRWLARQIDTPELQAESQQLRLESDRHLVQIVTIHKSKGLEFSLVWLPFIATFRQQHQALYHDRTNHEAILDLHQGDKALALAEEERLAEDLRLLYVALTRSVYHCSIGLAPLFVGNRKKQGETNVHCSAIGYLLQRAQAGDAAALYTALNMLPSDDIACSLVSMGDSTPWQPPRASHSSLTAKHFARSMQDSWQVTSYSALRQHQGTTWLDLPLRLDADALGEAQTASVSSFTPHTFPKGAAAGTFLHSLFESLDFTRLLDADELHAALVKQGLDEVWLPMLQQWLTDILQAPLNNEGLSLSRLSPAQARAEMAFHLPIDTLLQSDMLDALMRQHDPLSAACSPLTFQQVTGMLKGFIDLVFCWQGRYYVLDYKSNWLGAEAIAYTQPAMEKAMMEHRYDLQYQLYSLALHRYLRHRMPDYDYECHFGGVFYCFLRGMTPDALGQGIFFRRPTFALIAGMDVLFRTGLMQEG